MLSRSRTRTPAAVLALVAALHLLPLTLPATMPVAQAATVKAIVFPVEGDVTYTDTFGACRDGCTRTHEGIDIMGTKMQRLLSAVDGTVLRARYANSTGNSLIIEADDGWTYHYIHMNNDSPGTDDGSAVRSDVFGPGIVDGARVERGQLVGYLGDSGNAESTAPHNHFEIREPAEPGSWAGSGTAINPYESLKAATIWDLTPHWELARLATGTPAVDVRFEFGSMPGDIGLLCDWDGDGYDEPVVYRSGRWFLRSQVAGTGTAAIVQHGVAGDVPLCGDLDGDPGDEPVVFRDSSWIVRAGFAAGDSAVYTATYGTVPGDRPVLGDWDGDGDDDLGIWRSGRWYLRSSGSVGGSTSRSLTFGSEPGDLPIAGDWDRDGDIDVGIFRSGRWFLRSSSQVTGTTSRKFTLGLAGDHPVSGKWEGVPRGVGIMRPSP